MKLKVNRDTAPKQDRLLRLALNGDREALDRLFAPHMRALHRVARRLLRSPEEAEDAFQDGLLAALQHLREFQGRSQFSTWLTRIVVNSALMRLRKNRARIVTSIDQESDQDQRLLADEIADPRPNPEQICAQAEQFQILEQSWQKLPAAHRSAFWLRAVEGMRIREVAEVMGVRVGTLKTRLHRGRLRMIKEIRHALVPRENFERAPNRGAPRWHEPIVNLTREAAEQVI